MALGLGLAVAKTLLQVSRIQLTIGFVDKPIHSCRRSLIQQGGYLQFHDHTWHSWREHTTQIPDSWRNLGWAVHTKHQWRGFCEAHRERILDTEDDQGNINPVVLLESGWTKEGKEAWKNDNGADDPYCWKTSDTTSSGGEETRQKNVHVVYIVKFYWIPSINIWSCLVLS